MMKLETAGLASNGKKDPPISTDVLHINVMSFFQKGKFNLTPSCLLA